MSKPCLLSFNTGPTEKYKQSSDHSDGKQRIHKYESTLRQFYRKRLFYLETRTEEPVGLISQLVVFSVGEVVELLVDIGLVGIATETSNWSRAEVVVVTLSQGRSRSVNNASLLVVLHHGGRSRNIFTGVRQELSVDNAGLRGDSAASSCHRGVEEVTKTEKLLFVLPHLSVIDLLLDETLWSGQQETLV
jgi:hypothetical protein